MQPDYGQAATLQFDGQNLTWQQNGRPVKSWPAMSGKPYAQGKEFTSYADEGPIPEGNWMLKQNTGEHYNPGEWRTFDEFISGTGVWKLQPNSWGNQRIPIQPQQETNTFGRHSMYVHGGTIPGSSGCIDLTGNMENFYNDFQNYNGDIPLTIQYPNSFTKNK